MTVTVPYNMMFSERRQPMLRSCCFFFPLRTGCFIIGYLNLAFNTINIFLLAMLSTYMAIATHGFNYIDKDTIDNLELEAVEGNVMMLKHIVALLIVVICASAIWLFANIACLVGLHRRRPGPVRVYITFATIKLMLGLAWFIYMGAETIVDNQLILAYIIDLVLAAYFIMVYYSYAIHLENENAQQNDTLSQIINPKDITFIYPKTIEVNEKKPNFLTY